MGMLYYQCKNCGNSVGIQAQYIGNVRCINCDYLIEGKSKGVPRMKTWYYNCSTCNSKFCFEGCNSTNMSCVDCNKIMQEKQIISEVKHGT